MIHRLLFKDIYHWAGERRNVEISKGGMRFFFLVSFNQCPQLHRLPSNPIREKKKDDTARLSHKCAEILDTVNFLYPFREGNGRTQR
jgi:cell filamentation protein